LPDLQAVVAHQQPDTFVPYSAACRPPSPPQVAVKKLKPDVVSSSQEDLEAFFKEVAVVRKLKHKWVCMLVAAHVWEESRTATGQGL
jgi:hypothetical protein